MLVTYDQTSKAEIRAQMARKQLNQTQLAERLGWTQQHFSRVLSKDRNIRLNEVGQIAQALDVPITSLGLGSGGRRS